MPSTMNQKIHQQSPSDIEEAHQHAPLLELQTPSEGPMGRDLDDENNLDHLVLGQTLGSTSGSPHSSSRGSIEQSEFLLKSVSPEGNENVLATTTQSSAFNNHFDQEQPEHHRPKQQLHDDTPKPPEDNYFPSYATNPLIITSAEEPSTINSSPATNLSPSTILQSNTPSGCSHSKEPSICLVPPKAIDPNNLEPVPTVKRKTRRVQWVGLKERDSIEMEDCPSSSSHHSHQPHASQSNQPENITDLSPSLSDHIHPRHPHSRLGLNSSSKPLLSRPFSIRLPDRPTVAQFSQQIAAQRSQSISYHQSHQVSGSRENSSSSLALSTHQNTRANSTSSATITNTINPYFPSILPHSSLKISQHQTHSNSNRKKSLHQRNSHRHSLDHSSSDSREGHISLPMATPDHSRPATPDSDLDIPFGERDGLPSNPNRKPRTFTREAANLVSLHKYNISNARARNYPHPAGGSSSSGKKLGTAASRNANLRENRALGASLGQSSSSIPSTSRSGFMGGGFSVGNGVLSSLLHLYSHPASAQSSSATLTNYASDEESDGVGEGSQSGSAHVKHDSFDGNHVKENEVPTQAQHSEPSIDPHKSQSSKSSLRTSTDGFFSAKKRIAQGFSKVFHRFDLERPAAARSKAGVFGALQASAMGLGGVATPAATNIAPAVEKSGYRLARYASTPSESVETGAPVTPGLNLTSDNPYGEMDQASSAGNNDQTNLLRRTTGAGISVSQNFEENNIGAHDPSLIHGPVWQGNTTPGRLASSASSSTASIFKSRIPKSSSVVSLKALGEAIKLSKFHNESTILKAKKAGASPASGSTPGTPSKEFPYLDKTPVATPMGLPPQLFGHSNPIPTKAHQHNHVSRRRREKRRQEEIFITMHVAAILQRQQFILQLTRALMMFGGPSHRLESQILATARVLEIDLQVVLIYSVCIFSFQDEATHTSETKFIKQSPNVDLGKLTDLATLHWEVVHDKIGVQEASQEISRLMRDPPEYKNWQTILIGAMCSAFIGPAAFNSSFLDVLVSAPLGAGLVSAQLFVANKSDVLSQIFEIVITGLCSFVAAGLASSGYFCYSAITASSIVLILPGWLVCCAALELQSRSVVSGSVRLIWAVIYALFLGIGISFGAEFWTLLTGKPVLVGVDGTCQITHSNDIWYRRTIPAWSAFLVVPGYSLFLAMRQQARLNSKEIWVMVLLASGGYTANHFASIAFPNRSDISSALGSFVVGFLANIYGRLFQGTSFIVALVPILFQLPSGLANGGLLYFANTSDSSHSFIDGFQVGEQLLQVSLGLVIGLFVATVLVYPFGNRRGGLMAF